MLLFLVNCVIEIKVSYFFSWSLLCFLSFFSFSYSFLGCWKRVFFFFLNLIFLLFLLKSFFWKFPPQRGCCLTDVNGHMWQILDRRFLQAAISMEALSRHMMNHKAQPCLVLLQIFCWQAQQCSLKFVFLLNQTGMQSISRNNWIRDERK